MDDFVVLCANEAEAQRTLALIERQLATFRLQLNPAKTRIVNYTDGLEFLGQALVPKRRGPRWINGVRTFDESQERLRASAKQARRKLKR
jgi:RNA-directed DNA polymerase